MVCVGRFPLKWQAASWRSTCPDGVIGVKLVKVALQIVLSLNLDRDASLPAKRTLKGLLLLVSP